MTAEILWRLLAGAGLGAVVGLEREIAGQPAGLRTHTTVALGAALFGVVSTLGFDAYVHPRNDTNIQIDVTRVASQVVVGIGFLGAGLIFRQRGEVRNLTTAASLWVVSAVGLASGVGIPGAATIATVVLVATLVILRPMRAIVARTFARSRGVVHIRLKSGAEPGPVLASLAALHEGSVASVVLGKEAGAVVLHVAMRLPPGVTIGALVEPLVRRDDVEALDEEISQ